MGCCHAELWGSSGRRRRWFGRRGVAAVTMQTSEVQLRQWLDAFEGARYEFKEARRQFAFDSLVRYCVALANEGEDWLIRVADDGVGLVANSAKKSLGLEIVEALVIEDLRGKFQIAPNADGSGTHASLRIPRGVWG